MNTESRKPIAQANPSYVLAYSISYPPGMLVGNAAVDTAAPFW
jgi:hypothetical protein